MIKKKMNKLIQKIRNKIKLIEKEENEWKGKKIAVTEKEMNKMTDIN